MLWHFDCLLLRVVSFQDPTLSWKGLVTVEQFLDIHNSNCRQTRFPWGLGTRLAQSDFRRTSTSQYVQYFDQLSPRKYTIIPILSNIIHSTFMECLNYNKVWKIHFVLWGVEREGSDGKVKGEGEGRRGEERRMDGESNSECQCWGSLERYCSLTSSSGGRCGLHFPPSPSWPLTPGSSWNFSLSGLRTLASRRRNACFAHFLAFFTASLTPWNRNVQM